MTPAVTPLETPCREWRGGRKQPEGYGLSRRGERVGPRGGRKLIYVHRWIWETFNGPIPPGMHVCHRCDNPPCFRLDHLFLGTPRDNRLDAVAKGRASFAIPSRRSQTHCKRGHELSGDNLIVYRNKSGWHRRCRECGRAYDRAYKARKRAAA